MEGFVVSDLHSFYEKTILSLNAKGFKQNYDNHTLVVAGDVFDRGKESQKMKEFLSKTSNKICIIGNHELLLLELIYRGQFYIHDLSNGTVDAAIQLSGGYDLYPEIPKDVKITDIYKKDKKSFYGITMPYYLQKKIIENLIKTDIVEGIIDNFYIKNKSGEKSVSGNQEKTKFTIKGNPRYYLQVEDKLIMHGFFPSPDGTRGYSNRDIRGMLPDDYDLLDESTQYMGEEDGCGVGANTPYWLKLFHKFRLEKLLAYLDRRGIKHIYLGHGTKDELENMVITITLDEVYEKYHDKKPLIYLTDGSVVKTGNVIVETFTTK